MAVDDRARGGGIRPTVSGGLIVGFLAALSAAGWLGLGRNFFCLCWDHLELRLSFAAIWIFWNKAQFAKHTNDGALDAIAAADFVNVSIEQPSGGGV